MTTISRFSPTAQPMRSAETAPPAPAPAPPAPAGDSVTILHKLVTEKSPADAQKFQQALQTEIQGMVGGMVSGWRTPHVEKAAFPFQVNKQARIYAPIAAQQVAQNLSGVLGLLANPSTDNAILMNVETRLDPNATPVSHDLNDPDFRTFCNSLRQGASSRGNYECSGTLVNVGWGSGDHVNVSSSHLPRGPQTVSQNLAAFATGALLKP